MKQKLPYFLLAAILLGFVLPIIGPHLFGPKDYTDLEGKRFGMGAPCNVLNTTGRIAKHNTLPYYYISQGKEDPGIYRVSTDGKRSELIVGESGRCLNIYRESFRMEEWLFYINDRNELCRIKEDGSSYLVLRTDCASMLLLDRSIYFSTLDNRIGGTGVEFAIKATETPNPDEMGYYAQATSPLFFLPDENTIVYVTEQGGHQSLVKIWVEYADSEYQPELIMSDVPSSWWYNYQVLYIEDGALTTLRHTYDETNGEFTVTDRKILEGVPQNSTLYPTIQEIYYEGERIPGEETFDLYRCDDEGKGNKKVAEIDNIPSELYLFGNRVYQYDTQECKLHKIYRVK